MLLASSMAATGPPIGRAASGTYEGNLFACTAYAITTIRIPIKKKTAASLAGV
jgi:hypothetical protein